MPSKNSRKQAPGLDIMSWSLVKAKLLSSGKMISLHVVCHFSRKSYCCKPSAPFFTARDRTKLVTHVYRTFTGNT